MRKPIACAFSTRRVEALRPRIETFAQPLPITVICELLGVPKEDRNEIAELLVPATNTS